MKKTSREFTELNKLAHEFNSNQNNIALFGPDFYLLLQGNRRDGYKLLLMYGEIGQGTVVHYLVFGANKKQIQDSFDLLDKMVQVAKTTAVANRIRIKAEPPSDPSLIGKMVGGHKGFEKTLEYVRCKNNN
jgi:hypothetical protein